MGIRRGKPPASNAIRGKPDSTLGELIAELAKTMIDFGSQPRKEPAARKRRIQI
jgi:hypothetical protein